MKLNYTNDEMKILEAVSRTTLPIIIKGKTATGKSSLTEYIKEFNSERKHIIDEVSSYNIYTDEQKKEIKDTKPNQLVIAGHTIPPWMESELGDHIQIKALRLDKDNFTFKVGFVKIPEVKKLKVVLSENKHRVLAIRDSKPSKDVIQSIVMNHGEELEMDLRLPVLNVKELEYIVALMQGRMHNDKMLKEVFKADYRESPVLVTVYMHALAKEISSDDIKDKVKRLLVDLSNACALGENYLVAIDTEEHRLTKEFKLLFDTTYNFIEEDEEAEEFFYLLNFDKVTELISTTKRDVIIFNQTGKPSTQLNDYIDMYSFPRDQHVTVANIDNYYFRADILHELNKEYDKVVLTTNKSTTAYEEMLNEPVKITVVMHGGSEHYKVSNVELKLKSKGEK